MRTHPSPDKWTSILCRALAWLLASLALILAGCAYLGAWWSSIDALASFLPLAVPLVGLALLFAMVRRRSRRGAWVSAIALIAALLCIARMAPEWTMALPRPSTGVRVRIMTHNLHHGGANPTAQARMLAKSGADILLLQENDARSATALNALAPIYPYRDNCRACEVAILSRWPTDGVHYRFPGRDGKAAGPPLFRADVHVPGGGIVTVASLHAPRPLPSDKQARFFGDLIDSLQRQDRSRLILAGDFNLTPWSAMMRRLDHALEPMVRITRAMPSYPAPGATRFPRPLLPIDHLFIGAELRVESVQTLAPTGSDHLPIMATLTVASGGH
jgi:vancomycin resistance protein VanJ